EAADPAVLVGEAGEPEAPRRAGGAGARQRAVRHGGAVVVAPLRLAVGAGAVADDARAVAVVLDPVLEAAAPFAHDQDLVRVGALAAERVVGGHRGVEGDPGGRERQPGLHVLTGALGPGADVDAPGVLARGGPEVELELGDARRVRVRVEDGRVGPRRSRGAARHERAEDARAGEGARPVPAADPAGAVPAAARRFVS